VCVRVCGVVVVVNTGKTGGGCPRSRCLGMGTSTSNFLGVQSSAGVVVGCSSKGL
jgi:hypothetical protein